MPLIVSRHASVVRLIYICTASICVCNLPWVHTFLHSCSLCSLLMWAVIRLWTETLYLVFCIHFYNCSCIPHCCLWSVVIFLQYEILLTFETWKIILLEWLTLLVSGVFLFYIFFNNFLGMHFLNWMSRMVYLCYIFSMARLMLHI